MKVGILQLNATVGDFAGNSRMLTKGYKQACEMGAELVVAPELFISGYPPRDLLLLPDFVEQGLAALESVAKEVGEIPLCVGYVDRNPEQPGKPLFNAAAFLQSGKIAHRRQKTLLPTYDVFDEDRYFEPGKEQSPIPYAGRKIGLTICEDIWNDSDFWPERIYRRDPVHELVEAGADLIINLSASPWSKEKENVRLKMLHEVALDEKVELVYVNLVGGNDELIFDGQSLAFNKQGEVIFSGKNFAEQISVVDMATAAVVPVQYPSKEAQLWEALKLGLRDYVHKCNFRSVVIGLSGGIDSALVATIAVGALGPDNVLGVAMPSKYSSPGSLTDARALAKNLGIKLETVAIDGPVSALSTALEQIFEGTKANVAEENIQSRLRGSILMAISNKFNHLVLTTGNKSEMAVGYCTLYGDMCGALAVISDLLKTEVYALANWINREREIIPKSSITKEPSAELRPNQKDKDSLPPYDVLDPLLNACFIEENEEKSMAQLVKLGFAPEMVYDILNKITFSEYKRRQAAPGLKVSVRAFGVGRRMPVAQRYNSQSSGP